MITHLGTTVTYKHDTITPSLLESVERKKEGNANLGNDIWNCWEVSALLDNGCPFVGVLRLSYDSNSKNIIESKSLKLYLNSFNLVQMGPNIDVASLELENRVKEDLCMALKDSVGCVFHTRQNIVAKPIFGEFFRTPPAKCVGYETNPDLLRTVQLSEKEDVLTMLYSDLLKSNCPVTSQPDWGEVYLYARGKHTLNVESFTQYIVSFRDENHFHEETCELIYKHLNQVLQPKEIFVACLYTRRGGIDINPVRANSENLIYRFANNLITLTFLQDKGLRQ